MKRLVYLAMLFSVCLFFSGCGQEGKAAENLRSIKNFDPGGYERQTLLGGIPKKVLVLYPGAAEAMLELGLDEYVLQTVDAYGSEPEHLAAGFAALPKVKAAFLPSQEEVFAMHPELIIGWAHNFSSAELGEPQNWQERGMGVYIVPATLPGGNLTVENAVYPFIRDLGMIFGVEDRAEIYLAKCRQRVERAENTAAQLPRATAIVLQEHGRGSYSLYDTSYLINDVLEKAGLVNLVHGKTSFVGIESVLRYDPDYLVYVSLPGSDGGELTDDEVRAKVAGNKDLASLRAVKQGKIINVPFAEVNSGNGRILDALNRLIEGRIR